MFTVFFVIIHQIQLFVVAHHVQLFTTHLVMFSFLSLFFVQVCMFSLLIVLVVVHHSCALVVACPSNVWLLQVSLWLFATTHHSCILVVVHHSSSTIVVHCSRVFVIVPIFLFGCLLLITLIGCYWSVLVVVHHSRSYSSFRCIRCCCFPIWLLTILKHFGCCLSLYSCFKMFITQVCLVSPILFVCVYHLRLSYFV